MDGVETETKVFTDIIIELIKRVASGTSGRVAHGLAPTASGLTTLPGVDCLEWTCPEWTCPCTLPLPLPLPPLPACGGR